MRNIFEILKPVVRGKLELNAPMAKYSGLGVGGPADLLFIPADIADLQTALSQTPDPRPQITILGGGFNVLIRDGGIRGLTIVMQSIGGVTFSESHLPRSGKDFHENVLPSAKGVFRRNTPHLGSAITADTGTSVIALSHYAAKAGISGFEFLCGIPGTLGGAIKGNVGAYESNISGIGALIETVDVMDYAGNIKTLAADECGFEYRKSALPENHIIISTTMRGTSGDPETIRAKMADYTARRLASQPQGVKTCGSLFKNPPNTSAGKLIDECGWRGKEINGAMMSEKHANFLVNTGTATATDLENLAEAVRTDVKSKTGIELEWEIKRLGEIIQH